jgi:hypothetical protein
MQTYLDHIHKNLKLRPTFEENTQINFLDILITRKKNVLSIDIYRIPTTTDITMNYLSNHPTEQKLAAYHLYINRMIKFPLNKENKRKEWDTICKIARNNNFPENIIIKLKNRIEHSKTHQKPKDNTTTTKMGHIYILQPTNTKSDKTIQTHRNKNSIQKQQ